MDPEKCWAMILLGMRWLRGPQGRGEHKEERADLAQSLRDLADWIEKGGFIP